MFGRSNGLNVQLRGRSLDLSSATRRVATKRGAEAPSHERAASVATLSWTAVEFSYLSCDGERLLGNANSNEFDRFLADVGKAVFSTTLDKNSSSGLPNRIRLPSDIQFDLAAVERNDNDIERMNTSGFDRTGFIRHTCCLHRLLVDEH